VGSVKLFVVSILSVAAVSYADRESQLWSEVSGGAFRPWSRSDFREKVRGSPSPFWRKPNIQKKMREENDIVVSALRESTGGSDQLRIQGAGIVRTDSATAFEIVRAVHRLPEISERIRKVRHREDLDLFYIEGEVMGWVAPMILQIDFDREQKVIRWRNVAGAFRSMTGQVQLRDDERQGAEFSMTAFYAFEKLPLPAFLVEFGIEWALKSVAHRMREFIEQEARALRRATKEHVQEASRQTTPGAPSIPAVERRAGPAARPPVP
jgi:uncharacterized membrane protein